MPTGRLTMSSMRPLCDVATTSQHALPWTRSNSLCTHLALINAPVAPLCRQPNPVHFAAIAEPKNLPQKATAMTQTTQPQMMPESRSVKFVLKPEVALHVVEERDQRQCAARRRSAEQESRTHK